MMIVAPSLFRFFLTRQHRYDNYFSVSSRGSAGITITVFLRLLSRRRRYDDYHNFSSLCFVSLEYTITLHVYMSLSGWNVHSFSLLSFSVSLFSIYRCLSQDLRSHWRFPSSKSSSTKRSKSRNSSFSLGSTDCPANRQKQQRISLCQIDKNSRNSPFSPRSTDCLAIDKKKRQKRRIIDKICRKPAKKPCVLLSGVNRLPDK